MLDPSLGVSWRLSPRSRLSLDLGYRIIWGLKGDTLMIGPGSKGIRGPSSIPASGSATSGSSGVSYDAFRLSLSLDVSL